MKFFVFDEFLLKICYLKKRPSSMIKIFSLCILILFTVITLDLNLINHEEIKHIKYLKRKVVQSDEFSLNPKYGLCSIQSEEESLLFVSFVIIAPHYFEKRNEIRNTWANKQFFDDLRVFFAVGHSKNETVNEQIRKEFQIHQDILQINNLTDSYQVITIKIMKSLEWISVYCPKAKFILRVCDDVVVNTPKLIRDFKIDPFYKDHKHRIYGLTLSGVGPDHSPSSKWYVSTLEFNQTYPPEFKGIYPKFPQGRLFEIYSKFYSILRFFNSMILN